MIIKSGLCDFILFIMLKCFPGRSYLTQKEDSMAGFVTRLDYLTVLRIRCVQPNCDNVYNLQLNFIKNVSSSTTHFE